MRILIHDYAGHPFQVQLSRELARRGHDVLHLYSGHNNTPKGDLNRRISDPKNISIEGIFTKQPVQKYSYLKRWFQDLEYGNLIAAKINEYKPDVLLSANTPLDSQWRIFRQCRQGGTRFVFWLQDISGVAAYQLLRKKLPVLGAFVGRYHVNLERRLLRESQRAVLIAEDFRPIVQGWGVTPDKICVIPNWAPLDDIPVESKINPWSQAHNISEKFCFLYTGGLGLKHNPELLLQIAHYFRNKDDVVVLVVSEGPGAAWLKKKKELMALENLEILEYQPFDQVPFVMASADVLMAILEPDAGIFSVPSKVLTYLCAQRSLLLSVPQENLAAQIVSRNNAGLVVSPDRAMEFVKSAEILYQDGRSREVFAKNARSYAERYFDIGKIADRFEHNVIK
jgi:colanic acid biosynthesis glycosyl transferase WcaI